MSKISDRRPQAACGVSAINLIEMIKKGHSVKHIFYCNILVHSTKDLLDYQIIIANLNFLV